MGSKPYITKVKQNKPLDNHYTQTSTLHIKPNITIQTSTLHIKPNIKIQTTKTEKMLLTMMKKWKK